jgi:hypothetical protein
VKSAVEGRADIEPARFESVFDPERTCSASGDNSVFDPKATFERVTGLTSLDVPRASRLNAVAWRGMAAAE